ncbi:MAG: short-chain dehydrogenase [Parcubacteria group bacterium Gr01-1014_8]|nr:MAG: short-chain dehydrogenase [Parcubacteria group bacterium Gr01-1014_8]
MYRKNSYALTESVAFITGALGQIGREIVMRFLEDGAFVYIADKGKKISDDLAKKLKRAKFDNYRYVTIDVTSEESIRAVYRKLTRPVDVLVNCAGIGVYTSFESRTSDELDTVYAVNLKGTILCSKIFSAGMMKRKGGRIINIGSIYGITTPDFSMYGDSGRNSSEIYGATKAGIIQTTKYLAAYLAPHNILVNCVSPGGVFNRQKSFFVRRYKKRTPLQRMAAPDDLTGVIAFLASDEAAYITGQNIAVDGGFTIW